MAFLAGHCWRGTFPGRTVTDEHCFEWMYNGNYLRDRHVVRGDSLPYEGETTYAWDAQQKKIVYWYIALPGFFSRGTVAPRPGALVFDDTVITTAGAQSLRSTWRPTGADSFALVVEQITSAGAKELWRMEMKKQAMGNRQ
jgi:hypothetical protein